MRFFIQLFVFISLLMFSLGCGDSSSKGGGADASGATVSVDENDPESYIRRAKGYMEQGKYLPAIDDINAALTLDSTNAEYYHVLADAYLDGMESRLALATMDRVTKMYPTRIPSLLKYAEFQYIVKRFDNSISTLNFLLKNDNLNAEAFFMLGLNFHAKGELELAKRALQTAVENDPEIVDAWILQAELHEESDPKLAETYYNNAIEVSKGSAQARHSLAYFYQNTDRIDKAIELYRKIHIDEPAYMPAYMNAGILFMEIDSLDKAYEQFDIIVAREAQNANGYFLRAQVELLRGDLKKAMDDVSTALRLNPDSADATRLKYKIEDLMKEQAAQ